MHSQHSGAFSSVTVSNSAKFLLSPDAKPPLPKPQKKEKSEMKIKVTARYHGYKKGGKLKKGSARSTRNNKIIVSKVSGETIEVPHRANFGVLEPRFAKRKGKSSLD